MEGFNVAVIFSFLTGLAILVAKVRFIHRVLKVHTDVSVFNHSIALCFALSGEASAFSQFGIQAGSFTKKPHKKR